MSLIQSGPEFLSTWVQSHQSHLYATELEGQRERNKPKIVASHSRPASSFLARTLRPTPPSTVFVSNEGMSLSPNAKLAVIIRVLRYASCRPWGCVSAESNRRPRSLSAISSRVFAEHSATQKQVAFSAGSGVLWVPVSLQPDGPGSVDEPSISIRGWLAQRLPPPSTHRAATHAGMVTFIREPTPPRQPRVLSNGASVDVGSDLVFRFLFDCRFVVQIDLRLLPDAMKEMLGDVKHISMASVGKFSLPSVILAGENAKQYYWELPKDPVMPGAVLHHHTAQTAPAQHWITVEFARTLSPL